MNARHLMVPNLMVLSLVLLSAPLAVPAAEAGEDEPQPASAEQEGPSCKDNGECDRSQFCHRRAGFCNAPGQCAVRPQACLDVFDPVCGCDGKTYGNACSANMAGVNVQSAGECEKTCSQNAECAEDELCAKPTGDCDGKGSCAPRPEVCTAIFDPVCGCDGKVYPNACKAEMAGVSVASFGECR